MSLLFLYIFTTFISSVSGLVSPTFHHDGSVSSRTFDLAETRLADMDEPPLTNRHCRTSRRTVLESCIIASVINAFSLPTVASAATDSNKLMFPPIEYLEPMCELKLSVDGIVAESTNPKKYPRLRKRLSQFFSPTSVQPSSEAGMYRIISRDYGSRLQSSSSGDSKRRDVQMALQEALEDTLNRLKYLKDAIESGDAAAVEKCARSCQQAINGWFSLVPTSDVSSVDKLIGDIRAADQDRNGKLNKLELDTLPDTSRQVWERRTLLFGDSKVERCLGFKLTETSSY